MRLRSKGSAYALKGYGATSLFQVCTVTLWLAVMPAQAQEQEAGDYLPDCQPTPFVDPDYIPLEGFRKSNNLRRKTGAVYSSKGIYIHVKGRLVDRFCAPIQHATISIWQTDANGKYKEEYIVEDEFEKQEETENKYFGYTGKTYTNNLGEFNFITVLPGPRGKFAPHINVNITHPDFNELQTAMFFAFHPRNADDPSLKALSEDERKRVISRSKPLDVGKKLDGRTYEWVVALEGENRYKKF